MLHSIPFALSLAALIGISAPARAQLTLPTDFVDDLIVSGLQQPVGIAFLPDGRLLCVERTSGKVRLVVNGALAAVDPVGIVPDVSTAGIERGLLGIAVDPGWPARPYIYVHYNYFHYDADTATVNVRISRFKLQGDLAFTGNGSLTLDPATRYDILTDIPDLTYEHNGGTLRFGPQGFLYASIGDDGTSCQAQSLGVLAGKILRLRVSTLPLGSGGPPPKALIAAPGNPFAASPDSNARLVLYWGLRNPFRFSIDRVTGNLVIGDVGENTYEEINYGSTPGTNFEWPIYEGIIPGPTTCTGVDSTQFEGPIYEYDHFEGSAVGGGVIYRRPSSASHPFPPEYDGDIFLCDFYSSWMRRLKQNSGEWNLAFANGQPDPVNWATDGGFISDMLIAPDGSVWYCQMLSHLATDPGEIHRIRYTGIVSVPPDTRSALEFRAPHPSPSRGDVSFDFTLPEPAVIDLAVYDVAGRCVQRIAADEPRGAGPQQLRWNGYDAGGHAAGAGIYVAVLSAGGRRIERRFALVR